MTKQLLDNVKLELTDAIREGRDAELFPDVLGQFIKMADELEKVKAALPNYVQKSIEMCHNHNGVIEHNIMGHEWPYVLAGEHHSLLKKYHAIKTENTTLKLVIRNLLHSADASWMNGGGHDWPEAVKAAGQAIDAAQAAQQTA